MLSSLMPTRLQDNRRILMEEPKISRLVQPQSIETQTEVIEKKDMQTLVDPEMTGIDQDLAEQRFNEERMNLNEQIEMLRFRNENLYRAREEETDRAEKALAELQKYKGIQVPEEEIDQEEAFGPSASTIPTTPPSSAKPNLVEITWTSAGYPDKEKVPENQVGNFIQKLVLFTKGGKQRSRNTVKNVRINGELIDVNEFLKI